MLLSYTSMLCKGIKVFDNNYHFILGKNAYFEFMTMTFELCCGLHQLLGEMVSLWLLYLCC